MKDNKPSTCAGGERVCARDYGIAEYRFSGASISLNPDFIADTDMLREDFTPKPYDDLGDLEAELHEDADDDVLPLTPPDEDEMEQHERTLDGE